MTPTSTKHKSIYQLRQLAAQKRLAIARFHGFYARPQPAVVADSPPAQLGGAGLSKESP
jgi:hypothetical protein